MPSHRPWLYAIWLASAQVVTAQFNSTVSFTLTSLDGLVDVDGATSWWDGLPSTVDSETGYRTSAGRSSGTSGCSFVGTGFEVHGFGLWKYGEPTDRPWGAVVAQVSHPDQDSQDEPLLTLFGNVTRDPRLLSASNLSLSAYEMTWVRRADSQLQFHNLTVTIPIRTQAPSLVELQSQATFQPAVQNGQLQSAMTLGFTTKVRQFRDMFRNRRELYPPRFSANDTGVVRYKRDVTYKIDEGHIILKNMTELSYTAPPNTILIQVFGPVGQLNGSSAGSMCYADLEPPPPWWRNASFPISSSEKAVNGVNRTLFLLPIDPSVQTTVRVGTLGLDSTCFISGISSYPFHYNYTLAKLAADEPRNGTSDDGALAGKDSATSSASKQKHRTDIIVGVVVGVGGALILAVLLAWCLHRRKKQQQKTATEAEPYDVSEKDLYRTASWTPHNALDWPDESRPRPEPASGSNARPRPRRVVQEQDAEEEIGHQPPTYGGGQSTDEVPRSTPDLSSSDDLGRQPVDTTRQQPPTLKNDYVRAFDGDQSPSSRYTTHVTTPTLKEEYSRVFGVPRSPGEGTLSTSSSSSSSALTPPLKEEYARAL